MAAYLYPEWEVIRKRFEKGLSNCPFCNNGVKFATNTCEPIEDFRVVCENSECPVGPRSKEFTDPKELYIAWNKMPGSIHMEFTVK